MRKICRQFTETWANQTAAPLGSRTVRVIWRRLLKPTGRLLNVSTLPLRAACGRLCHSVPLRRRSLSLIVGVMSTAPVEIRPWRECPFTRGRRYRVLQSFAALRDSFTVGNVLIFDYDAWSRYDGITGYFFRQSGRDVLLVWDVDDDADIQIWRELFEELSDTVTRNDA